MDYIVSASTDKGLVKDTNQDSYGVRIIDSKIGKVVFAVVCDGMGGYSKGELASGTVVAAFDYWAEKKLPMLIDKGLTEAVICKEWNALVKQCNEKIMQYGLQNGINLGTTLTGIMITESKILVINVGDSRVYRIGDDVDLLTKDQTIIAQEIEMGRLTEEQAKTDPRRSVLLQCIGASDVVVPDITIDSSEKNVIYLLCSDGFRHEVSQKEMQACLSPDFMTDCDKIKHNLDALINLNKQRLERDNITAVAIRTF